MYSSIISLKNLFTAWKEFQQGKKSKKDVLEFTMNPEQQLLALHEILVHRRYIHGGYHAFKVYDPKLRNIHKASVLDRILHHAVHRILVPLFERRFIFDSYSSRKYKGVQMARDRFHQFAWKLSRNNTQTVWIVKCDIRKFFDSLNHEILLKLLSDVVPCTDTLHLLENIIRSYNREQARGIPLGNLTSQLFSNVYMDCFDQFVKRELRVKYYLRYADDFVVMSQDKNYLEELVPIFQKFLKESLKLELHPKKVQLRKWHQGIDFLGAVLFPYFRVLRTKTKKRALKRIRQTIALYQRGDIEYALLVSVIRSYLGIMTHVCSFKSRQTILAIIKSKARQKV